MPDAAAGGALEAAQRIERLGDASGDATALPSGVARLAVTMPIVDGMMAGPMRSIAFSYILWLTPRSLFRAGDFFEDFGGGLGPDEGLGVGIVVVEVVHDGGFEFGDAVEDAAADALVGDLGEEALDQVEPRARRWA